MPQHRRVRTQQYNSAEKGAFDVNPLWPISEMAEVKMPFKPKKAERPATKLQLF